MQRLFRSFLILLASVMLASCWLPDDFTVDLNIRPDGRYAFRYDGAMTAIPLLRVIAEEKPNPKKEQELAEDYRQDLLRDSAFQEVRYLGLARFQVKYQRQGDIVDNPTFYFVRLNSKILAISQANGVVSIYGDRPPPAYRKELIAKGFDINGTVRVWTDAPVIRSNAEHTVDGAPKRYEWTIRTMEQPAPDMQIRINRTKTPQS